MTVSKLTATAKAAQGKLEAEARRRIKRVGTAAKQLEDDLKWIATHKAWELLGHQSFAAMFEGENGYESPFYLQVLVHGFLEREAPNTAKNGRYANGYTHKQLAQMVGLRGTESSRVASSSEITSQRRLGVAPKDIQRARSQSTRARQSNWSFGKGPDELVSISFHVPRRIKDWYRHEAKTAVTPIPDAELYRQVLIAHMDKVEMGRKASRRTSRSRGKAA